jgi:CheY-like chemotaxis protein
MATILVFENNSNGAESLMLTLSRGGYKGEDVRLCTSPAKLPVQPGEWDALKLILLDLIMGDDCLPPEWRVETCNGMLTGLVALSGVCPRRDIPLIIITALSDDQNLLKLLTARHWPTPPLILRKASDGTLDLTELHALLKKRTLPVPLILRKPVDGDHLLSVVNTLLGNPEE